MQDLSHTVEDSDVGLHPLMKYIEGDNFDLRGISDFLSSPNLDPNLQCAGLRLIEHAAEWQSTNFAECMPVAFGPVVKLVLDSKDIQAHCAALDTLKLFLTFPNTPDIIKSMISSDVVDAISRDLNSSEPFVQSASVELLDAASRSEGTLVEFAAAIPNISRALLSMPTATKIAALRVLEICADSDTHELVKAVADTFHYLDESLCSADTTIQIAALKVLGVGVRTEDPDLARAVKTILPAVMRTRSSGKTEVQSAGGRAPEVGAYNDQQASRIADEENDMDVDPANVGNSCSRVTIRLPTCFSLALRRGLTTTPSLAVLAVTKTLTRQSCFTRKH